MKVIESIRYNRTGDVNDAPLYNGDDLAVAMVTMMQAMESQRVETARNLFTTVAIRVEF